MGLKITVSRNDFARIGGDMRKRASAAVRRATFDIEAGAKATVPVDTGALKNSIQGTLEDDLHGVVSVGMEYGPYVEYGTRHQAAHPFLHPPVDRVTPVFEREMSGILRG